MITHLPLNMQAKIQLELCPVAGLPGFCWGWTGALTSKGYGSVSYECRIWSTHRLAYELLVGSIPSELQIDHLCVNKRCCNPAHLEPVTGKVNCERTDRALKSRCINGHPLVEPNLVIKPRKSGLTIRNCRVCALDSSRRRRAKQGQLGAYAAADKRRAQILLAAEAELREDIAS